MLFSSCVIPSPRKHHQHRPASSSSQQRKTSFTLETLVFYPKKQPSDLSSASCSSLMGVHEHNSPLSPSNNRDSLPSQASRVTSFRTNGTARRRTSTNPNRQILLEDELGVVAVHVKYDDVDDYD